jgi:hypothetical protein
VIFSVLAETRVVADWPMPLGQPRRAPAGDRSSADGEFACAGSLNLPSPVDGLES